MKDTFTDRMTTLTSLVRRYKWKASLLTAVLLATGILVIGLATGFHTPPRAVAKPTSVVPAVAASAGDGEDDSGGVVRVRTIRPRKSASLELTVEQPAYVEAYYRADLEARVAGPVKFIEADIGEH